MDDLVVLGLHGRRIDAPTRRRRLLQHLPHGGAALAHRLQEVADAARSVGVLVAVSRFVARRLQDFDARPVGLHLVGHDHRQAGARPRTHLGAVGDDRHLPRRIDRHEHMRIIDRAIAASRLAPVAYRQKRGAAAASAPTTSAPEATSPFSRNRRLTFSTAGASAGRGSIPSNGAISNPRRSKPHGGGDALVAAAAADIAGHGAGDFLIRRMRRLLQQRGGLHDLSGLAIAALRHVQFAPGLLHRMVAVSDAAPRW